MNDMAYHHIFDTFPSQTYSSFYQWTTSRHELTSLGNLESDSEATQSCQCPFSQNLSHGRKLCYDIQVWVYQTQQDYNGVPCASKGLSPEFKISKYTFTGKYSYVLSSTNPTCQHPLNTVDHGIFAAHPTQTTMVFHANCHCTLPYRSSHQLQQPN